MKLRICSSAHSLEAWIKPELPVTRGPRHKGVSGCHSSLVTAPSRSEMGRVGTGLLSVPSCHSCWMAPYSKEGCLNTSCPPACPVPKFFIKWRVWGRKNWKPVRISHPLSCNWYLELFLTLIYNSGVFLPIGQKTDKCSLGLANKSIKIVKPSAKRKMKPRKRGKGMSEILQCHFNYCAKCRYCRCMN